MKLPRTTRLRAAAAGSLALAGALVLGACGSDDNTGDSTDTGGGAQAATGDVKCSGSGELLASGSSAQKNAVDQWVSDFQGSCPDITVNYKATGSGAGIQEFLQGKTGFAGSDSALKPEEVQASKKVCKDGEAINIPMLGGPIAIGYNVEGVDDLVLDPDVLGRIFDGSVTTWNDPAIADLNPDADLPDTKIQPVHRSDESGTTDNFTQYLSAAAQDAWPHEPGKKWPVEGGQAADGSAGVSSQVQQTDGAISYFELSYATASDIDTVKLDTGASEPVEATSANASKAIANAKVSGTGKDLAMKLDYTTDAEGAYPLTLLTYEIACDKGNNPDSLDKVKSFLGYTASEAGQSKLSQLGYAPLPDDIAGKVRTTVESLS
ncbi:phosphate ABC transporter substrate-binding protein PstS [Streptomyces sp. WMMC500]|uniref:phosphate ABC transporter substrate-binding protein PstS n=1 Tax=Streptomyces sp. WMMC500 TaxID=3015154 RepID=UPI00248B1BFC|nr:phosphate ABC transporter substrate-binding protein PstS [Streptomyces sp. WMMC500]WBB64216.1 phosphate ABC transporter substrate-binding protein PstS [Streptomyces sp. WMMC500]